MAKDKVVVERTPTATEELVLLVDKGILSKEEAHDLYLASNDHDQLKQVLEEFEGIKAQMSTINSFIEKGGSLL